MNVLVKSNQDVPMSRRRAKLLAEYANRLSQMLENAPDNKDLAEWVQSKIDRAASAIQSAFHYLEYDELEKGASHKYIRRIPKGRDKRTGRMRYDYVYKEHHRGGLRAAVEDVKAGEAFKLTDPQNGQKGHFHVKGVKGSVVVVEHDETGRSATMTKSEFKALLMKEHGQALKDNVQAKKETYERMKRESPKSIGLKAAFNRLKAAAEKAGVKVPQVQTAPEQATPQPAVKNEISLEDFEQLKSKDRIRITYKDIVGNLKTDEFEVGRTTKTKRGSTKKRLYRVTEQGLEKTRAPFKLNNFYGRGRITMTHSDAANKVLEFSRISDEVKTAPEPAARAQLIDTAKPEPAQPAKIDNFELAEHTHTKTGVKLYTAKQRDRVDRDEFKRRVQIAKKYKGRYDSRYAKAYLFKNPEDARKFALEVEGKPTDSPTTAQATNNFETMPEVESTDNFETMPESKLSDPHRARKEKVFKEVTTGELYQTRALIDENEIRGVYENQTLASLKRNLEPERLAAESGIQESGLLQGIENATRISQLAKEYKDFQVRTAITFDRKDKAVLNERGNPRGISDFIREKLNLNSVKDVRAQKDEIEKIASELLRLGVDNAVKRAKETATKRKNKISADGISIFDNHITEAEKRLEFIQTSNLKDSKKLIDGIKEAIKLTKEAKEVYKQKSGNLLDQAISKNSNRAIINGLLENSSTRYHFTINPKGPAAKKLTETIVQSTLSNVLKDVAQDNFETMPEVELPPKGQRTVEDAKKWFGEPSYFEQKTITGTKRYFQYEKDGLRVRGGPVGAKGQLLTSSRSRVYTSINLTPENKEKISGAQSPQMELGEYNSIDEALRAAINSFDKDPQSMFIDFRNRDRQRDRQSAARRMGLIEQRQQKTPARTELIEASDVASDKTDGLKGSYWDRNERPEIKRLLSETVSRGHYQASFQTGYTPSLYDLKQVVQSADKLKLVEAWNRNQDTHNQIVNFAEKEDFDSLKALLKDFRTDYLSRIARNSLHNGYGKLAKRVIRDSKTAVHRELAKQEYLDFEKEYVARAKQIFEETRTETDAQIIQHLKERYFRYKDRPSEFSTAPRLTPSERAQITKRFDEAAAKLSANNFETMPDKEFLASEKIKKILDLEDRTDLDRQRKRTTILGALDELTDAERDRLFKIRRQEKRAERATGQASENFRPTVDSAIRKWLTLSATAKQAKEEKEKKEKALSNLDKVYTLTDVKATDLSYEDTKASYRGVSFSAEKRAESTLLEFQGILDRLEKQGLAYIEAGASFPVIRESVNNSAKRILAAKRAQNSARSRTMSAMITGRGNFPVRSQQKRHDAYDKRMLETAAVVENSFKRLSKLDPKRVKPILQGSGTEAYEQKLAKLEALQESYKKQRAEAKKRGLKPNDVVPKYLMTNNGANIRRVKEQIQAEKRRAETLEASEDFENYTLPDGMEMEVSKDQADNRLRLTLSDKPEKELREKLKRAGYRWSPSNQAWQRQLTENALALLPSLLSSLKATKDGEPEQVAPEQDTPEPTTKQGKDLQGIKKRLQRLEDNENERSPAGRIRNFRDMQHTKEEIVAQITRYIREHLSETAQRQLSANDNSTGGYISLRKPFKSTAKEAEVLRNHGGRQSFIKLIEKMREKYPKRSEAPEIPQEVKEQGLEQEWLRGYEMTSMELEPAPAPQPAARAQLIEASDQSVESAAVRITQGLTEEKLTDFSKDLTDNDVSQIYDRARFLTVAKEKPTKTLMRSKKQRAIDNELIIMHRRLDIHAERKLGPLKPRITEAFRYDPMFKEGTREPEHREKIRTKIKRDIEKLYNALNTVSKSAHRLINYRAALYRALNNVA